MTEKQDQNKIRILMIDDDLMLLKLYEMAIRSRADEFELFTATSAREGLDKATTQKPDIILLDLILGEEPGVAIGLLDKIHGFNVLMVLKGDQETKQIPVIIFSNLDTEEDREKGLKLGASDYFVKAKSSPKEVLQQIKATVELSTATRRLQDAARRAGK